MITKEYIAGFFDADGYISISKPRLNENATIIVGFTNNVREILEEIQDHILSILNIKGSISVKQVRKVNHHISYDLKFNGLNKGIKILEYLPIKHPKKINRLQISKELKLATNRNGKYEIHELIKRELIVQRLLNTLL